jgi:hypothetical protein
VDLDGDDSITVDKNGKGEEGEKINIVKYVQGYFYLKIIMIVMGDYSFFLFSLINVRISSPRELMWNLRGLEVEHEGFK